MIGSSLRSEGLEIERLREDQTRLEFDFESNDRWVRYGRGRDIKSKSSTRSKEVNEVDLNPSQIGSGECCFDF